MYLLENPVLQRELLVNLRMTRGFVLLFLYQALLARSSISPGRRTRGWTDREPEGRAASWWTCSSWASTCWPR